MSNFALVLIVVGMTCFGAALPVGLLASPVAGLSALLVGATFIPAGFGIKLIDMFWISKSRKEN